MSVQYGGDKITFADGSSTSSGYTFRNRIINGAMVIDQRNAGASVTIVGGPYTLDRWKAYSSPSSKYAVQQNAGSVTPPVGFSNYLGCTSSSAYSITSGDYFFLMQRVEGYNIADLAWGTIDAKTVTVSFWVRSSLTGTFGGVIQNDNSDRSYPFTYTISSANTWEQKSVTIAGPTSGTWLTTNGNGLSLIFGLGVGSTYSGTPGTWGNANYLGATGSTSVVGTNGATFYITGVQLEVGSSSTTFEYRDYGRELVMCQRYYQIVRTGMICCCESGTTQVLGTILFPVCMRTLPSVSVSGIMRISDIAYSGFLQSSASATVTSGLAGDSVRVRLPNFTGLTEARWYQQNSDSSAGHLLFSAEL